MTNIRTFVRQAYFQVKIVDQDKSWAPHKVCKQCVESLRTWTKGTRDKFPFGIPIIRRESGDHASDCQFCVVKMSGYNNKKRNVKWSILNSAFPSLSFEKIKAGVINGPQIRQLVRVDHFIGTMTELQTIGWHSETFLEIHDLRITPKLSSYKILGCNMNIKLHFLHSHLADFQKNLGVCSDERGERFHQDLKVMEARYEGRQDDRCWLIIVGT